MAVVIRDLTTCYKCERPIMSEVKSVHPLCEICDQGFHDWFNEQLEKLK